MKRLCPCQSGKAYEICCKPFHEGKKPENALELMRSRYAAYCEEQVDYIIKTTHPQSPLYKKNLDQWKADITTFCRYTDFEGLEIQNFIDGPQKAYVAFLAHLAQNGIDASFMEKSYFEKIGQDWFYHSGTFENP